MALRSDCTHDAQSRKMAFGELYRTSLVQTYRKTKRKPFSAAAAAGFAWIAESPEAIRDTASTLAKIATHHDMSLTVFSQPGLVGETALPAARITDHANTSKVKGNRPHCLCHASRNIGAYDICSHGCAYCFAVSDPASAKNPTAHTTPTRSALGLSGVNFRPWYRPDLHLAAFLRARRHLSRPPP